MTHRRAPPRATISEPVHQNRIVQTCTLGSDRHPRPLREGRADMILHLARHAKSSVDAPRRANKQHQDTRSARNLRTGSQPRLIKTP